MLFVLEQQYARLAADVDGYVAAVADNIARLSLCIRYTASYTTQCTGGMRKVVSEVCVNAHDKTRAVSSVGKACAAPYVWISNKLCCIGYDGTSGCASGAAGAAGIIRAAGIAGRRIIVRASSVRRCCCRGGASCAGRCVVCRCCIICSTACGCFCCCLSCCFCLAGCKSSSKIASTIIKTLDED